MELVELFDRADQQAQPHIDQINIRHGNRQITGHHHPFIQHSIKQLKQSNLFVPYRQIGGHNSSCLFIEG